MADYAVGRTGGSLRDALNQLYPMLGMGEYNAGYPPTMFPPNTGAEPSGSPPVPIPRQRPPMPPVNLAPPGPTAPGPAPGLAGPVAMPPSGVNMPMNFPAAQQLYQGLQANQGPQMAPGNYAARLRQFGAP